MRSLNKLFAVLFVSVLTTFAVSAQTDKKEKQRVRFAVELDCHSCINKINKNIPYEKGVTDLASSLEGQWVEVEFRGDKTDTTKLIQAFKKIGKDAKVIETTPQTTPATTPKATK